MYKNYHSNNHSTNTTNISTIGTKTTVTAAAITTCRCVKKIIQDSSHQGTYFLYLMDPIAKFCPYTHLMESISPQSKKHARDLIPKLQRNLELKPVGFLNILVSPNVIPVK